MNKENSVYATLENRQILMAMYDDKLSAWPVAYECLHLPTRFGETHVIAGGDPAAPPVVLFHAAGVNATMWSPNFEALGRQFRLYAVDTIGDLGRSRLYDLGRYPRNGAEYSQWAAGVMDGLGVTRAHVIGASMGGWLAMNLAMYQPGRVDRLVLLGPMGMPSWWSTMNVLGRLALAAMIPTQKNKEGLIQWVLGGSQEAEQTWGAYLKAAVNGRPRLSSPYRISDNGLQQIQAPTLLVLGEHDGQIGNAYQAAARARRCIPHVRAVVMPDTGHLMSTEKPEWINAQLIQFLNLEELRVEA
ncbi:MAG: alpha/beta hydrolase [Anaerolineaceae bacterium]|nr:alpha/beta hydrolase [Anaerolineaceae bacterium]